MRTYDLAMTHALDTDDFFILRVQQHCAERGLNFFLIDPTWVEIFYEKLRAKKVWPRVILNMHSEHHRPEDIYHRLIQLAFNSGAQVIDPPDVARAAFDKSLCHWRLQESGFKLPYTLIVSREQAVSLALPAEELERLGTPFVIKPSLGYGKHGVVLDATGPADLLRSIRDWHDSNYLLQQRVAPRSVDGEPAYFRIFFAFGSVWTCWWNCFTDRYRPLTLEETERLSLKPLREIACRLASVSRMRFFSTEVALTEAGEFVLIDYINDQCHMLTQTANPAIGVPDEIVGAIARRLVEGAHQMILQGNPTTSGSIDQRNDG